MKIREGFILQSVAESHVVVPVGEATTALNGVIMLNESGVLLWNLLKEDSDPGKLPRELMNEYGISADKAAHDTDVFLDSLRKIGCLEE